MLVTRKRKERHNYIKRFLLCKYIKIMFLREYEHKINKRVIDNCNWYGVLSKAIRVLRFHSTSIWELFLSRYKFDEWLWTSSKFNRLHLGHCFTYQFCVCVLIYSSKATPIPHHDHYETHKLLVPFFILYDLTCLLPFSLVLTSKYRPTLVQSHIHIKLLHIS
jgi:hypothetical protein